VLDKLEGAIHYKLVHEMVIGSKLSIAEDYGKIGKLIEHIGYL